jgi:hypothetical protein
MTTGHPTPSRSALALACLLAAAIACSWPSPGTATHSPTEPGGATPSVEVPVPIETSTPTEETDVPPPGWLTYRNEMLGYAFDYPADAQLGLAGVTGYPTDELPAGLEPGQYFPTLEAAYPEALCVSVVYGNAYVNVGAPDELGGRYSTPCGLSGIGVYDLVPVEETINLGDQTLSATGSQVYTVEDHTFVYEFYFAWLDGFRFNYGGDWTQAGATREAYLADKAVILQVLSTWRWLG